MKEKVKKVTIEEVAEQYQQLDREIKALESKQKPLRQQLIHYAEENKASFDEAFQLKFPNGTYISLRVSDCIDGDKNAKIEFAKSSNLVKIDLDEKAALLEVQKDTKLRKLLTQMGLRVAQKETFAVYAG
jgi:hypothetical protein